MEIENLSLRIDEAPLNELITKKLPKGTNLQELKVVMEEGEVSLEGNNISVAFKDFKIQGMPAALFKNMLIEFITEQTEGIEGIIAQEKGILIVPEAMLKKEGIKMGGNLQKIECLKGAVRIIAGT